MKGWPKGVKRPTRDAKLNSLEDGSVEILTDQTAEQVAQSVTVATRKRISLKNRSEDPFTKFKTDEKRYSYRALNTNSRNMREKEAEGWEPIAEAKYGDLILAKIPREDFEERSQNVQERTQAQTTAAVESFREEAAKNGVQVDQDSE